MGKPRDGSEGGGMGARETWVIAFTVVSTGRNGQGRASRLRWASLNNFSGLQVLGLSQVGCPGVSRAGGWWPECESP